MVEAAEAAGPSADSLVAALRDDFDILAVHSDVSVATAPALLERYMLLWAAALGTRGGTADEVRARVALGAPHLSMRGSCYSHAFVGSSPPSDAAPHDWASVRSAVATSVLGVAPEKLGGVGVQCDAAAGASPAPPFALLNVTIIDRRPGSTAVPSRLVNIREVARVVEARLVEHKVATRVAVRVVYFEDHAVAEQAEIALNTHILVGAHGNGLTWAGMLRPRRAAVVEVWPAHAFNGNYAHFARMMDVAYFALEHSRATAHQGRRRGDVHCNLILLARTIAEVAAHFHGRVACDAGCRTACAGTMPSSATPLPAGDVSSSLTSSRIERNERPAAAAVVAAEREAFGEWLAAAKRAKLWGRLGVQKRHLVHAWHFHGAAAAGFEGIMAHALATLGLQEWRGSAAELLALRHACSRCGSLSQAKERAVCLMACNAMHKLAVCLSGRMSRAHREAVTASIAAEERERQSRSARLASYIRRAQADFFRGNDAARLHWNAQNPDDTYTPGGD